MLLINAEYSKTFIKNIKNAKTCIRGFIYHDSIYMSVNGSIVDNFITELRQAQNRGVVIKILCQSERQIEKLRRLNFQVKLTRGFKTMHSKAFCFDNNFLIVGSHNFTDNANKLNLEMSILSDDKNDIIKYINYFDTLWQL